MEKFRYEFRIVSTNLLIICYDFNCRFVVSCRPEQAIYDSCIEEKLGPNMKPGFGHFAQMRIHETKRPKPVPFTPEFPDKTPAMPDDYKKDPAIGGSRNWIWS